MKLLFDQNLSHKLALLLADLYPGSDHVRNLGLDSADDAQVWSRAAAEGFVLVTNDEDFFARSLLFGAPPLVPWVRSGNCATDLVETLLRRNSADIFSFGEQADVGFFALY